MMSDSYTSDRQHYDFTQRAAIYDQHRKPGGPYADYLLHLAKISKAQTVLEIGPGTGNSTETFLGLVDANVIGVDLSFGMLSQASQKELNASWVQGRAETIPLPDESVDMVFSVLVSHHINDLDKCLHECRRVLKPGGAVGMVTTPSSFISNHPLTDYFPSFATIDLNRFPDEKAYSRLMETVGLNPFPLEYVKKAPEVVDAKYLDKVKGKFISTLDMFSDEEFMAGVEKLEAEITVNGRLEKELAWEAVIVSAQKK